MNPYFQCQLPGLNQGIKAIASFAMYIIWVKNLLDFLLLLGYSGAYEGEMFVKHFLPKKQLQHCH